MTFVVFFFSFWIFWMKNCMKSGWFLSECGASFDKMCPLVVFFLFGALQIVFVQISFIFVMFSFWFSVIHKLLVFECSLCVYRFLSVPALAIAYFILSFKRQHFGHLLNAEFILLFLIHDKMVYFFCWVFNFSFKFWFFFSSMFLVSLSN